jgi:hypothetical protein
MARQGVPAEHCSWIRIISLFLHALAKNLPKYQEIRGDKKMKRTFLKLTVGTALALLMIAGGIQTVSAQEPPVEPRGFGIVGTWDAEVTLLNCTTGVPLFPPGRSLVSYVQGGTFIEEASGTPPSMRYPGLGVWMHVRARTYALAFKVFQYNADGTSNGKIVVVTEVEHNLDDTLTSSGSVRLFNAAGDLTATLCVSTTGTRFTGVQ